MPGFLKFLKSRVGSNFFNFFLSKLIFSVLFSSKLISSTSIDISSESIEESFESILTLSSS